MSARRPGDKRRTSEPHPVQYLYGTCNLDRGGVNLTRYIVHTHTLPSSDEVRKYL